MPAEGIFQNLMIVAIRKSYPGHARKVMHAIWGLGQAMFTKCIVVVDEDVNVQDSREVAWKALNTSIRNATFSSCSGPSIRSTMPPAGGLRIEDGHRRDAKWPEEGFAGRWPDEIKMDESTKRRVDALWAQLKMSDANKR